RKKQLKKIDTELRELRAGPWDAEKVAKMISDSKEPAKAKGQIVGDALVSMMLPAVEKVLQAEDRIEQIHRNLHVAFALAAHRSEQGRYPKTLDALAPKYLPQIPGDLFSGKALIYRPAEKGYLFYSVGANGKDDGGRTFDDNPPGDDLRVRM